jgi:hypothetical protein
VSEVYANASEVATTLGGPDHGHLGLFMTDADYAALPTVANGHVFVVPQIPGAAVLNNLNAENARIALADHAAAIRTYKTCMSMESQMKGLILAAVPHTYLAPLKRPTVGFAGRRSVEFIEHLKTNYGVITQDDLEKNLEELEAAWDPDTPVEELFARADECRAFATTGGDPISDATVIRELLKAIRKSGVMDAALSDWRKKPALERTYTYMLPHFRTENVERIRLAATAGQQGYTANAAGRLASQNAANAANAAPVVQASTGGTTPLFYCWTHGLNANPEHTSASCAADKRVEGHNEAATADNMMGGNNYIRRRRGEARIYTRPGR